MKRRYRYSWTTGYWRRTNERDSNNMAPRISEKELNPAWFLVEKIENPCPIKFEGPFCKIMEAQLKEIRELVRADQEKIRNAHKNA